MTTDELGESLAYLQAMTLNNRHLLQFLFEEMLATNPDPDATLRKLSDRMTRFYEKPGTAATTEANLMEVSDSFITHLRANLRPRT